MFRRVIILTIVIATLSVLIAGGQRLHFERTGEISIEKSRGISLVKPAFAQTGSYLTSEANIAAYAKVDSIELGRIKDTFKLLEADENDHLIGIINVANAPLLPHFFASDDGWLVAYFLRDEIIGYGWPFGHGINPPDNVLVRALTQVGAAAGLSLPNIKYYSFKYPGANKIMVIKGASSKSSFQVQIPNEFQIFDAGQTGITCKYYDCRNATVIVLDKTSSVKKGDLQNWVGALILVYNEP